MKKVDFDGCIKYDHEMGFGATYSTCVTPKEIVEKIQSACRIVVPVGTAIEFGFSQSNRLGSYWSIYSPMFGGCYNVHSGSPSSVSFAKLSSALNGAYGDIQGWTIVR